MNQEKARDRKLYREKTRYRNQTVRKELARFRKSKVMLLIFIMCSLGASPIPGVSGDKPYFRRISSFGL